MQSFYENGQSNHEYIWINSSLDNKIFSASTVHILCGRLSIYRSSDSTSVWTVSLHLIQIGLYSDNVIAPFLKKSKQNYMALKDKVHIPAASNTEAFF